jgi:hypothetical protein
MSNTTRSPSTWKACLIVLVGAVVVALFGSGWKFGPEVLGQYLTPPSEGVVVDRLVALELAPEITDEMLAEVRDAMLAKAAEGDVEAAAVVLELASRQRSKPVPAPAPDVPQE